MLHEEPAFMAAEKLTKARLAQILITLLVLISAFLWRTFSHESGTLITCGMEKPCQFDIEGKRVTVSQLGSRDVPKYSISPWDEQWSIEVNGSTEFQSGVLFVFPKTQDNIELKINNGITLKLRYLP
ncbi:hypothetical protein DDN51_05335 [Vibrio cholerae]|uniref:Uncharacterized protein n=2 Tax=Vibrio cholerae TaxID=666 RepID=A0ABD7SQI9_VIBCL|nr:hypothetical protein [Vibrio cholerae]TXX66995.1 hypothetical protein FXF03_03225 [Vibrio cholerae]